MLSTTRHKLHLLLLAVAFSCSIEVAQGAEESETAKSVPKSIQDIVQMIKASATDSKQKNADMQLIQEKASPQASAEEQYVLHYLQAQAADRLGRIDLRIQFLKKALEFAKPGTSQEFVTSQELAYSEIQVGNAKSGIDRYQALTQKVPTNMSGFLIGQNASLSRAYAQIGDFDQSQKYLRETEAFLVRLKTSRAYPDYGFNWNKNYYHTRGELAYQRGQFLEAELSFKTAISFLESGMEASEKKFLASGSGLGVPGTGSGTDTGNPAGRKAALENLYAQLSDTLLKLRKVNEAEYFARESLKKTLARTGKSSINTSNALRQLAIVMLSRERNQDALYLLNESLRGLQEAGVTGESIQLALTKKTLASALIANEEYAKALKVYAELDETAQTYPETGRFVDLKTADRVFALVRTGELAQAEKFALQLVSLNEARTGKTSKETTQAKLLLAVTLAEQRKDDAARTLFATSIHDLIEQ
ncbi:MAG: hypothetical protein RLZZ24_1549, partial [Pseudomonadota bacterium]